VTGLTVEGTESAPVIYVTSSDPRIGAGGSHTDSGLDTNSGVISRLTQTDSGWDHDMLVRGLPRSEENHATNGIQYDAEENVSDRSSVTRTVRFSTEVDPAETGTFNSSTPANVTMNVMVENTDGSGLGGGGGESTGSSINPNSTDAVVLTNSTIVDPQDKTSSRINITLRNRDQNDDRDLTEARFNFYSIDRQSSGRGNRRDPPKAVEISNTVLKSANVGGEYRTIDPIPITAGNSTTFTVEFYKNSGGTAPAEVKQGDFFVVSVIFENGRDATYFIAPTE